MAGWVYVAEAVGEELFKVGQTSNDPFARLSQLQTGCPHRLDLVCAFTCDNPVEMEAALRGILDAQNVRVIGEWFRLPRHQVLDMLMHFFANLLVRTGRIQFRSSSVRGGQSS